ncbi:MAG: phytanoyl-CoA dioxygenase family protein [Ilumatobacteraceae bacterium]
MSLASFPDSASVEEVNSVIERDGGAIIENYLTAEDLATIQADLLPLYDGFGWGTGVIGEKTRRFGCLFRYSVRLAAVAEQKHFIGAADYFLTSPHRTWYGDNFEERANEYRLTLTQAIGIYPGQGHQGLHRDDLHLGVEHPCREVRVQVMVALSDFTAANGGTNIVPGSHHWTIGRGPNIEDAVPTEMKAGSAAIWLGGVFHGGRLNTTDDQIRYGVTMALDRAQYGLEENHFLVYDRATIEALPPLTRKLLGYEDNRGGWGYVLIDGRIKTVRDLLDADPASPHLTASP